MSTLKLGGHYLAMVTISFQQIVTLVMINAIWLTRGPDGISKIGRPALFQWGTRDPIVGADRADPVAQALGGGGWALSEHAYDMAHSQTIEMMVDARTWLAAIP
mgnify:CR=1 FL=1